jgi:hypothetical protein
VNGRIRSIFVACCLALPVAARIEPPLPVWKDGERAKLEEEDWFAGGLLLTDEAGAEPAAGEEVPAPLDIEAPTAEELAADEPPPTEIPEKFLAAYFEERPEEFIIDPQGLLSAKDHNDRLGFLNYHAGDSSIDLFIYLFASDQEIPGEVREEETIERLFSDGRPAAVVFYYLGAPQRSILYLSPSLTDAVPAAEQRRALQSSVIQAFESASAPDQLEAFLVQMSIRIYWMERMLGGRSGVSDAVPPATGAAAAMENAANPAAGPVFSGMEDEVRRWLPHAVLMAGIILVAYGFRWWLAARARFRFPEFEVESRLGGAHAAGVGAVISFASAAVPPASQRDQVPDYLRRA